MTLPDFFRYSCLFHRKTRVSCFDYIGSQSNHKLFITNYVIGKLKLTKPVYIFQITNHGIDHGLMDRVKEVCSQQYKINREQHFKDSSPVRELNKAIEAELKGNNVEKIENLDWEDVFQVHEMKETNSWPSEPKDFKYVQYSINTNLHCCTLLYFIFLYRFY